MHKLLVCLLVGSLLSVPTALADPASEPTPETEGIICEFVLGPDSCSRWPIYVIEEYLGIP